MASSAYPQGPCSSFINGQKCNGPCCQQKTDRPTECCIYNVPNKHRKINEEAYVPQVVSIGPLHRNLPHLQGAQSIKKGYLELFCLLTGNSHDRYIKTAKTWDSDARLCYESNIKVDPTEFGTMILEDGVFVVLMLLKICIPEVMGNHCDEISKNELMKKDILQDILLLENQLPLFVLKELYGYVKAKLSWNQLLNKFAENYFKKVMIRDAWVSEALDKAKHLVDYYHILSLSSNPSVRVLNANEILKFERYKIESLKQIELSRSAQELYKAGLKFKKVNYLLPFDLNFEESRGELQIPQVTINRWTEVFFTNLMAYEHCIHKEKIITSFVILMASLLKDDKDARLLINQGIIHVETLGNEKDVCKLFRELYNKSMMNKTEFFYPDLCKDLNDYSRDPWHKFRALWYKWMETLRSEYFTSPWTVIVLIVAILGFAYTTLGAYDTVRKWKTRT